MSRWWDGWRATIKGDTVSRGEEREKQMELMMLVVRGSTRRWEDGSFEESPGVSSGSISAHSSKRGKGKVRIMRVTEGDDIEAYLTTFEIAPFQWGRAQAACAALEGDKANDYDTLKVEILCRYDINEETYWLRFRIHPRSHRNPKERLWLDCRNYRWSGQRSVPI